VRNINDLTAIRLGAQVGSTSHTAATAVGGETPVAVYNTNGDAKLALASGEIDALVADLPTAFAVGTEIRDGLIVGQLPNGAEAIEQFGIVLDKDSSLTRCVSSMVDALRADGTLARLQTEWLADAGTAPVLS
jgi:polar amino acid transport system substrate-binding protein